MVGWLAHSGSEPFNYRNHNSQILVAADLFHGPAIL